jgi:tRNA-dihydrouridine synthase B
MKLYLAPVQGFTNSTFRSYIVQANGNVTKVFSPFVDAKRYHKEGEKVLKDIVKSIDSNQPLIPQVLGSNSEDISAVLNRFKELGFEEANINMGCPFPPVATKQMGSGLIPFPEKIDEILNAAFQVGIKISVKIRLGWTSSEELEVVIPILNKYDLTEVVIHPRIGKQQYKGNVDLDAFERYAKMLKAPVGYSGDICTVDELENLKAKFPFVDSWMIGRGAISNPIIFKTIEGVEPSRKEVALAVKQLHNLLFDEFSSTLSGPSHLMNKIKPYWDYFEVVFLPDLKQLVKKTEKAGTVANYQAAANDLFAKASREFE